MTLKTFFSFVIVSLFIFSVSCSSSKPSVQTMNEGQVNLELSSYSSIGMGALIPTTLFSDPAKPILNRLKVFAQGREENKRMFSDEKPETLKTIQEHAAQEEQDYINSLPGKLESDRKNQINILKKLIRTYLTKKSALPERGQKLVDRKIYFIKNHINEINSKYANLLNHFPQVISELKEKAEKTASK